MFVIIKIFAYLSINKMHYACHPLFWRQKVAQIWLGRFFFGIHSRRHHRSLAAVPSGESFLSLSFCFCPLFPSYCLLCLIVVPIQIVMLIVKQSLWAEGCQNLPLIFSDASPHAVEFPSFSHFLRLSFCF